MSAVLTKKARNNLVVIEVENFVMVLYLLNFPRASMTFWSKMFTSIMTIPVTIVRAYVNAYYTQISQQRFQIALFDVISENDSPMQQHLVYRVEVLASAKVILLEGHDAVFVGLTKLAKIMTPNEISITINTKTSTKSVLPNRLASNK